jgi:hypothetical protein
MCREGDARDSAGMDIVTARRIAHARHVGRRTRTGRLVIDHVERVAAAVPPDARAVALLHDVLERTDARAVDLAADGLTAHELEALRLLTRAPGEDYDVHVTRIARAEGPAGRLARVVKLADLEDHLGEGRGVPDALPYAWAYGRIVRAQRWRGEATGTAGSSRSDDASARAGGAASP